MVYINDDEQIDDLQVNGLKIIQKKSGFKFGIDAVLLANFVQAEEGHRVLDIGTGTGIIAVLIAGTTKAHHVMGIDIQADMVEMAQRTIVMNGLEDRASIIEADIKNLKIIIPSGSFDVVATNPPYINSGCGLINADTAKACARHEILCTLEDVIREASRVLKTGGRFNMVHRPDRLVDIIYLMRKYKVEPKLIRFIHPYVNKRPNLLLIRGLKSGNTQLTVSEPLYVYNEDGSYTKEIKQIYRI